MGDLGPNPDFRQNNLGGNRGVRDGVGNEERANARVYEFREPPLQYTNSSVRTSSLVLVDDVPDVTDPGTFSFGIISSPFSFDKRRPGQIRQPLSFLEFNF